MKIKFHCNNCMESFQIEDRYLVEKESVTCPNCDSKFPEENFKLLKQGVSLIRESRSQMVLENTEAGYTHRFDFTIID